MDSGRLIFDSSTSHHHHGGQMLLLGGGNPVFQGARSVVVMEEGTNRRRPFFTSPEELLEEEYYDEQLPEKKRRLTPEQVHMLEQSFEVENKLEPDRKSELARKLGLQPRQVAVWFQNRRARWKTKQLERDFDRLKASYDALLADHDALVKDNDHLRSQVASMTEKIEAKELVVAGIKQEDDAAVAAIASIRDSSAVDVQQHKAEDRLSTGSRGSAVMDGESPQLVDSTEESYFQESYQGQGGGRGGCRMGIPSEEDDGSDEGCSYLPSDMFAENHGTEGWWVWN